MKDDDRRNKWRDKQDDKYFEDQAKKSSEYARTPFGFLSNKAGSVNTGAKVRGVSLVGSNRITASHLLNIISIQGGNPLVCDCAKCSKTSDKWQVDHIKPIRDGGSNSKDNIQLLCLKCHKEKTKKERRARSYKCRSDRKLFTPLLWEHSQ